MKKSMLLLGAMGLARMSACRKKEAQAPAAAPAPVAAVAHMLDQSR